MMRITLLILSLFVGAPALAADTFASVCPDFPNDREPDMQMQPGEFSEETARKIIQQLRTTPQDGLVRSLAGVRKSESWAVMLTGYLLRAEWKLAVSSRKTEAEVEKRRKEFCQFLVKDGYRLD